MELVCKVGGLIEAPTESSPRVERHWNGVIDLAYEVGPRYSHQGAQWLGEAPSPVVLEGLQDCPQRALVLAR